jgi:hypothetical protein
MICKDTSWPGIIQFLCGLLFIIVGLGVIGAGIMVNGFSIGINGLTNSTFTSGLAIFGLGIVFLQIANFK